jgi:hypothetical protein
MEPEGRAGGSQVAVAALTGTYIGPPPRRKAAAAREAYRATQARRRLAAETEQARARLQALGRAANSRAEGVWGVPQDPFAPRRGPSDPLQIGNAP